MSIEETKVRLLNLETVDEMENLLAELTPEQSDELKDSFTKEEKIAFMTRMMPHLVGPAEEAGLAVEAKLSCVQEGTKRKYIKIVVVLSEAEFSESYELEFYATDKTMASLIVQAVDDGQESSSFLLATSQEAADEQTLTE